MPDRGYIKPGRKQFFGWTNNTWDADGKWIVHGCRDMFDELVECESQEEFLKMAEDWIRKEIEHPFWENKSNFDFIIMNICLSYQTQKRESEVPWTFRSERTNWDRYDDFLKEEN